MGILRYFLLAATAGTFAEIIYILSVDRRSPPWFVYGWLICLVLNFVYLVMNPRTDANATRVSGTKTPRVFRIVDLWFDAKETELRARANRSEKELK
jgi:hypothetical protein